MRMGGRGERGALHKLPKGRDKALFVCASQPGLLRIQACTQLTPFICVCAQKGQKCVQLDAAVGMWQLLFNVPGQGWPLIEQWCEFLTKHHNRAISKDTWSQLLDFIKVRYPPGRAGQGREGGPYRASCGIACCEGGSACQRVGWVRAARPDARTVHCWHVVWLVCPLAPGRAGQQADADADGDTDLYALACMCLHDHLRCGAARCVPLWGCGCIRGRMAGWLQSVKPDFSNYDESAAWPYLLDEFVEHVKEGNSMAS